MTYNESSWPDKVFAGVASPDSTGTILVDSLWSLSFAARLCDPPISLVLSDQETTFEAHPEKDAYLGVLVSGATAPITTSLSGSVPKDWTAGAFPDAKVVQISGPIDQPGNYKFTVTVTDARGCSAQLTITVHIALRGHAVKH